MIKTIVDQADDEKAKLDELRAALAGERRSNVTSTRRAEGREELAFMFWWKLPKR